MTSVSHFCHSCIYILIFCKVTHFRHSCINILIFSKSNGELLISPSACFKQTPNKTGAGAPPPQPVTCERQGKTWLGIKQKPWEKDVYSLIYVSAVSPWELFRKNRFTYTSQANHSRKPFNLGVNAHNIYKYIQSIQVVRSIILIILKKFEATPLLVIDRKCV